MNKIESIKYLKSLKLNTPKILLELSGKKDLDNWSEYYARHEGRVSIRTEKEGSFKCPHHPNIKLSKAGVEIKYLISQGYKVYVFEAINPDDCLMRGNFIRKNSGECSVEYLIGPGTVRELEKVSSNSIQREDFKALDGIRDQGVYSVIRQLIPLDRFVDSIIEWSYYKTKIGCYQDYVIFWELRPWQ
jgi:hypothetical protein